MQRALKELNRALDKLNTFIMAKTYSPPDVFASAIYSHMDFAFYSGFRFIPFPDQT